MKISCTGASNFKKSEQVKLVKKFINFLQKRMPLNQDVKINFLKDKEGPMTTGLRRPGNIIEVLCNGRMLIDVLRTLSHEWVHEYQFQKLGLPEDKKIQNIGGPEENMANAVAGILVKSFEKENPELETPMYE